MHFRSVDDHVAFASDMYKQFGMRLLQALVKVVIRMVVTFIARPAEPLEYLIVQRNGHFRFVLEIRCINEIAVWSIILPVTKNL